MLNESSSSNSIALPRPYGDVVRTSGAGNEQKKHFNALTLSGKTYELEDTVLIVNVSMQVKPFVAIIRDIYETDDGKLWLYAQWFYRPEDIENIVKDVETIGARELYYSFHKNEVPAEWIAHKCVVHVIPENIDVPNRKQHPGFVVQKLYNPNSNKLMKLQDDSYIQYLQDEIDQLINKTMRRLGINRAAAATERGR
ncbi:protein REPRESSOR OF VERNALIZATION 1-like [Rutidosis leptorrhynchoides]|uniref:protein REPRESSOR OF VERNALIZATION 1-like n=1 Tax=Rutidosis leptorrhynchoides TaxID=125765 RepID=UPI003A99FFBC